MRGDLRCHMIRKFVTRFKVTVRNKIVTSLTNVKKKGFDILIFQKLKSLNTFILELCGTDKVSYTP